MEPFWNHCRIILDKSWGHEWRSARAPGFPGSFACWAPCTPVVPSLPDHLGEPRNPWAGPCEARKAT